MKIMSKITIGLFTATLLFVGCSSDATPAGGETVKPTISEESLGLRKTNLYAEAAETEGDATRYSTAAAGTSKTIKRAFQDAPPMIPHDVEGMLPITIKDNQCTGCHMPEVAPSVGATAIPSSHFTNFRAATAIAADGRISKNGVATDNTSEANMQNISIKKESRLVGARFNCSQCHAPQSDSPAPKNNFEAVFTSSDGASASSWSGTKLMEGIDTTK
ncbi:MAG: nitrate reductase cytochrome c-type subunit [Campylobacterota bacterium]|nr:nitrate reductase cytochrome c-type subunit [Campylobacterota bacterium]